RRTGRDERSRRRDRARPDRDRRGGSCRGPACCTRHHDDAVTGVETAGRELFVRHAKKDGRSVTILRAVAHGMSCAVEPEVFPPGVAAGLLVAFGVRVGLAWLHVAPNYFPDEYLYSALGRSFAGLDGPSVRGASAHFPALLQPLLTAPAWRVGDVETAFRLVQ